MKYAIVQNGVVVNIAIADNPLDANWIRSDEAGIGWLLIDGVLVAPEVDPNE